MARKTATFISERTSGTGATQRTYKVDPPMDTEEGPTDYVVVSAVNAFSSGDETYIFPGTADGEVTNWMELDGSFRGAQDHVEALRGAGYKVVAHLARVTQIASTFANDDE